MTKRIIFVDDELEIWETPLREELGKFGFDLKCKESPANLLKSIASYNPDVILLDILFPEGPLGKPTLKKIKEKYPNLPVIMFSSIMDKDKSEYDDEDYKLADFLYFKEGLAEGDFSGLAMELASAIERAEVKEQLKDDDTGLYRLGFIVGKTKVMQKVVEIVEKVVDQDQTVLITGESGTGKGLVARSIHDKSRRQDRNFVTVVCAALSKELLESELFGHEKGAFTGAALQKKGKFEVAEDGTIFLDEIGEMPLDTQVKLLRFLQEKKFERVGGNEVLWSDARIIAATNRNLEDQIKQGKFREDLYYRLKDIVIHLPSLRKRKTDIPQFFIYFVNKANERFQKSVLTTLRDDVKEKLVDYPWPGNIRQFENAINSAVALADGNILQKSNFPDLNQVIHELPDSLSDVSHIVDSVYDGKLKWDNLKKDYCAGIPMRKEVFLKIIDRWTEKNEIRPTSKDLAGLLSASDNNIRRVLKQCGIKLTALPKQQ